jgi:hypothetical protein
MKTYKLPSISVSNYFESYKFVPLNHVPDVVDLFPSALVSHIVVSLQAVPILLP